MSTSSAAPDRAVQIPLESLGRGMGPLLVLLVHFFISGSLLSIVSLNSLHLIDVDGGSAVEVLVLLLRCRYLQTSG